MIGDGRLGYNAGLVEGRNNIANSQKDVYGHLNYKIGGMRMDGVIPGGFQSALAATHPWEDNSMSIGGFVYNGTATLDPTVQDDEFTMFGGDVNVWFDRLNLIGAFTNQHDKRPIIASPDSASDLTSFMVEGSYILYPWLVPLVRLENSKVKDAQNSDTHLISAIQFLIRANVRAALEFNFASEPSATDPAKTELNFEEFAFGLTFGL